MSVTFTHYAKIMNHYCFAYFGLIPEYVVQLRTLRPHLEKLFPEVRIFIAVRDEIMYLLDGEKDLVPFSQIHDRKNEFAYIREVNTSVSPPHAMSVVFAETPALKVSGDPPGVTVRHCLVCPDGALPTKPHPDAGRLKAYAQARGYRVTVIGSDLHPGPSPVDARPGADKLKFLDDADWVIGVENEYLFEAVRRNIKTSLIPTGIGANIYKLLAPHGEIITV